jgi:hypothetical protein
MITTSLTTALLIARYEVVEDHFGHYLFNNCIADCSVGHKLNRSGIYGFLMMKVSK